MAIIEVTGLVKRYGETVAVNGVSFTVDEGEIFGILGPNGAGKTTTVECIEGLRAADSGTITVDGLDPRRDGGEIRRRVGVQSQESELPERMKVREALDLYSSFYPDSVDWRQLMWQLDLKASRTPSSATSPAGRSSGCRSRSHWWATRRSRCSTS